tara:strand:- start:2043 stop:2279 length:237 start_codon:yes stop_codon:yes gene_type:complete
MSEQKMSPSDIERVNKRLSRMSRAIGSNKISGSNVSTLEGKHLMSHMLTSVLSDDFNVSEAKQMIVDRLQSKANNGPK